MLTACASAYYTTVTLISFVIDSIKKTTQNNSTSEPVNGYFWCRVDKYLYLYELRSVRVSDYLCWYSMKQTANHRNKFLISSSVTMTTRCFYVYELTHFRWIPFYFYSFPLYKKKKTKRNICSVFDKHYPIPTKHTCYIVFVPLYRLSMSFFLPSYRIQLIQLR